MKVISVVLSLLLFLIQGKMVNPHLFPITLLHNTMIMFYIISPTFLSSSWAKVMKKGCILSTCMTYVLKQKKCSMRLCCKNSRPFFVGPNHFCLLESLVARAHLNYANGNTSKTKFNPNTGKC